MFIKRFREIFESVPDFRQTHKVKHVLNEVLFMGLVATIANCDGWVEMADYA